MTVLVPLFWLSFFYWPLLSTLSSESPTSPRTMVTRDSLDITTAVAVNQRDLKPLMWEEAGMAQQGMESCGVLGH